VCANRWKNAHTQIPQTDKHTYNIEKRRKEEKIARAVGEVLRWVFHAA
jgi:hypothetical protein